nr:uncharacterized protein LOC117273398 [Nicotiana tomentosiformis]
MKHLRKVFQVLRDNGLYIKREKFKFAQSKVHFLGHVIRNGELCMDEAKVRAIQEWEAPIKVTELRSFLGLVNYYRRFICGYSAKAAPLTELLKKNKPWVWTEHCQRAFEDLKAAVTEEPVLALPDFAKTFEVHTDASDFAIGGILMQDKHPIAFESRKLNETERHYTVQEKEMTTIVHCLRTWRHYLLGSRFVVKTDNDFLAEFDYVLEYKPGKGNVVADSLSRKAELAAITSTRWDIREAIKEGMQHDLASKQLIELANHGNTRRFWVKDGLLLTTGRRENVEQQKPGGLLEPLTVAERPWESVTMDFITCLPKSDGYGTIMVVVDRFSKYAIFMPATPGCTAKEAAKLFFKNVVKYWGLPRHIISDRDPRFIGNFWRELFDILGTELHFSTSFHPQTDGQTERVNALLECYLRHYSTGRTPFELATGQQPQTPHSLPATFEGKSLGAYHMAKGWEEHLDTAKSYLDKAAKKMKKFADRKRRPTDYRVGDMVMVKFNPRQFKALRGMHQNLIRKYEGPFKIVAKVGKISYKLDMPSYIKIYHVFHASMLKPYHEDKDDPSRGQSSRAHITITASHDREIEAIIDYHARRKQGQKATAMFLVHWKRQSPEEATWERYEDL